MDLSTLKVFISSKISEQGYELYSLSFANETLSLVVDREQDIDMEEAIKELQKKSWIPVNDSLPEEIHTINYYDLVCGEASFTESDMVLCRVIYNREIQYVTGIFTGGQWYLYHDMYNEETEELHVTHWMPLPEPPEQKGEES